MIVRHHGPHPGIVAIIFMLLFMTGLFSVVSLSGAPPFFPGPWEEADVIIRYFRSQQDDVLLCAFFQFCAAVPLGIFTAAATSRLSFLGSAAAGNNIALAGGLLCSFNLVLSSLLLWVMAYPGIADDGSIIRALYYIAFAIGGVGYAVPMGLLIAGITVQSWFMRTLPRWLSISGIVLALIGISSTLYLVYPNLLFLIPLTRFPGFIWLIFAGFFLPQTRQVAEEPEC